jgi:hypothetical protein
MAEPNSAGYFFDMLLKGASPTGSGPYTYAFTLDNTTDPRYYTLDISLGSQVVRFVSVQASKIAPVFEDGEMRFDIEIAALKSFYGREISNVVSTTLTLSSEYDSAPNEGLVAGDLIYLKSPDGSTEVSTTVTSVNANGTDIVVGSASGISAGDMVVLRPSTPSINTLTPFLWGKTEFRFGATASAALSATQTRLDDGTEVAIEHAFEESEGSKRSGDFDPASLVRTVGDATFKVKKFFDAPDQIKEWNAISKKACVMRCFSGSTNQYELRITLNDIRAMTDETPTESEGVVYHEVEYAINYDDSDGQGMDVKVINNIASLG